MTPQQAEAFVCPRSGEYGEPSHHYHTTRQLYVGTSYIAICCRCGRTQLIVYHGMKQTPDLHYCGVGTTCGPFVRG